LESLELDGSSSGIQRRQITRYARPPLVDLPDRRWPGRVLEAPPIWCSVDLRDGNQALAIPMSVAEKLEMFKTLVRVGLKEIEIGFPASSQIEFDFTRQLIENNLIPDDVTIQVLVQARDELIYRTIESLHGAKRAIVHVYNSTSPVQRRVVFGLPKPEIVGIATRAVRLVKDLTAKLSGTRVVLEYSPESFTSTELEFALEICEAVVDVWRPTPEERIILNLPATVEIATPNVHADQIEWFCRNLRDRRSAVISLHTHNDRGTGIAATELGLLAGADRVEGTLFGNGERTGNADLVTLALNMYAHGIDSGLDFSDLDAVRAVYERCTRLEVPIRHPYAGELVFTAFSGSHQDAINKGMAAQDPDPNALWEVPYLPIDPKNIGRSYKAIIRINSQSGKGGVAYIMDSEFGFELPKDLRIEFGKIINAIADARGEEIPNPDIFRAFEAEYLSHGGPLVLESFRSEAVEGFGRADAIRCNALLINGGVAQEISARGNGPIDAFVRALAQGEIAQCTVLNYSEHSLSQGSGAEAVAYIQIRTLEARSYWGVAIDTNIELASIKAVVSAVNRSRRNRPGNPHVTPVASGARG
jgi:2-isopropylmalate synthase